jgi:hypothetical protein
MKLSKTTTLLAVALVSAVMFAAAPASAGTGVPWLGEPNSIFASFSWNDSDPLWHMDIFDASALGDYPLDSMPAQAMSVGPDLYIEMPNFIDPLPIKYVHIDLFFNTSVDASSFDLDVLAYDPVETAEWEITDASTGSDYNHYIDLQITPNPDNEIFQFFGVNPGYDGLNIVEISTISVPEPATLGLLIMGGLVLLRRRR